MRAEDLLKIIRSPIISEKSTQLNQLHNVVVFKVNILANKYAVKYAVEKCFQVDVEAVRLLQVKGKVKRKAMKGRAGKLVRCQGYKKAYVTLSEKSRLNFLDAVGLSVGDQ